MCVIFTGGIHVVNLHSEFRVPLLSMRFRSLDADSLDGARRYSEGITFPNYSAEGFSGYPLASDGRSCLIPSHLGLRNRSSMAVRFISIPVPSRSPTVTVMRMSHL